MNKPVIEDANSSDLESSDFTPYLPTDDINLLPELEHDESVYDTLDYITLEWPSQTIAIGNNTIYCATNPDNKHRNDACIVQLVPNRNFLAKQNSENKQTNERKKESKKKDKNGEDVKNEKQKKINQSDLFNITSTSVDDLYNRIRVKDTSLLCVSDKSFDIYCDKKQIFSQDGKFAYGLASSQDHIAIGRQDGRVLIYDNQMNSKEVRIGNKAIETLNIENSILFAGGCDKKLVMHDLRTGKDELVMKNDCDINSLDYNSERNLILFGDDRGKVRIVDLRHPKSGKSYNNINNNISNNQNIDKIISEQGKEISYDKSEDVKTNNYLEVIDWHKSPISLVKWHTSSEFVSLSDEQVAIWDVDFCEEWEYHRWLRFVHQGQRFYKDVDFLSDHYVVTSIDGVCVFSLALE